VCCGGENCFNAPNDCRCPVNQTCNPSTGQCECTPNCPQDYCGGDGCGGTCSCPFPKVCIGQQCYPPPQCGNGLLEPWGGEFCDGAPCSNGAPCTSDCRCGPIPSCPNGAPRCVADTDCSIFSCKAGEVPACRALGMLSCCICLAEGNQVPDEPITATPLPVPLESEMEQQ
jgi:hypothetical protein